MRLVENDKTRKYLGLDGDGTPTIRVLRLKTVLDRIGIGRSTAYDWMNSKSPRYDPTFPHSIKLSGGCRGRGAVGWVEADINRWIDSRIAAGKGLVADTAAEISRRQAVSNIIASVVGGAEQ